MMRDRAAVWSVKRSNREVYLATPASVNV